MNFKTSLKANVPGWNGKLLAHVMGWFGEPTKVHRVSRYLSNDPAVIKKQLDLMQSIGVDGILVTWQGPTANTFLHDSTIRLWEGCLAHGMLFGLVLDPWIAKGQANPTQATLTALQSVDCQRMLSSPAYLPEQYILEFDLANSAGVDIVSVQAAVAQALLSWHTGFSWPNIPLNPANPTDSLASLKSDNLNGSMKAPGINLMFNDAGLPLPLNATSTTFLGQRNYAESVWGGGPARVIDHQAGNWLMDQLAVTPTTAPYIALVTWNDHDEGTGVEHVIAGMSGIRLGR